MNHLTIADVAIRTDAEGRYCLNDLHRAAGGDPKHQPFNWLRLDSTRALCSEIDQSSEMRTALKVQNGGTAPGTYVCKELVYAYAMWISPAFNLKVIRAYDALVSAPAAGFAIPQTMPEALRLAAEALEQKAVAEARAVELEHQAVQQQATIEAAKPKVQFYDAFRNADGLYGLDNAARALNIPPRKFTRALHDQRFLFREGGVLVPYAEHRQKAIFHVKVTMVDDRACQQTYITPKGLTYFSRKFADLIVHPQLDLAS